MAQHPGICSYYGEEISENITAFSSSSEAREIIEDIINVIGLKPRFEVRQADVPNAAAVILKNKRFVLYNSDFISTMNTKTGNKWASVSILAHEIGHHLNGHTLEEGGSRPEIELEADEFSGFVLQKLGASLQDAQAAMRIAASVRQSHTHPARQSRLEAIKRGWEAAGENASSQVKKDVEKPAVMVPTERESPLIDEKFIAYRVHFNADKSGIYYITIRNNLVLEKNDKLYILGRLSQSNKKGYPLMLHDKQYNYLYVSAKGTIFNRVGRIVGIIRQA